jgi:signal peptidase I
MPAFVVRGASMAPGLCDGDVVLTHRLRRPPAPGDLIVYRHPHQGFFIVHRVIRAADGMVWTAGDSNADPDPHRVSVSRIAGKVWMRLPRVGRLVRFVRKGQVPS